MPIFPLLTLSRIKLPMLVATHILLKLPYLGGNFSCLLITFANSLDTDQAQQNVGPDLNSNYLSLCHGIPEIFSEGVDFENMPNRCPVSCEELIRVNSYLLSISLILL